MAIELNRDWRDNLTREEVL